MKLVVGALVVVLSFLAGCDPDTSPVGGAAAGADAAVGGAGGSAGAGGTAGDSGAAGGGGTEADADTDAEGDAAGGSAGATGYTHSIVIDGNNDFDPAKEQFDTSSMTPDAYRAYVTWDEHLLYVGMEGKALADKSAGDWVVVYIGGTPGTQTGITYGPQTPGLPMPCKYHVRWKADGQYTNGQVWNGSAWVDTSPAWLVAQSSQGTFMEMSISRLDFDFPDKVQVVLSMMREAAGYEWTWAGVPAAGLTDGKNPSYTKYFEFDFSSPAAPNSYTPLP